MSTEVMKLFKKELTAYSTATATIHFTADKPLSVTLVKKLVKARKVQNETRLNTRLSKKHKADTIEKLDVKQKKYYMNRKLTKAGQKFGMS